MHNILVTGIGGNVGQGVLKNLIQLNLPIRIIGTNVVAISPGNYMCDKVYKLPYAYEPEYIPMIKEVVEGEKVDLIIPTTDYECLYLSRERMANVMTSPAETNEIFVNKYKTYLSFKDKEIPFAMSYLPSEYDLEKKTPCIFKPKEGRGSRGIVLNPKDKKGFSDSDYMVQEYVEGPEITSAFYVSKSGELHGIISMYRELGNGATVSCYVTFEHQKKIEKIIQQIVDEFKIKGSCNLQSRVRSNGEIVPFEVNGRISGTNSIRSHFGFNDVKYMLQEYIYEEPLDKIEVKKGAALRILNDIIYPGLENVSEIKGNQTKHILF